MITRVCLILALLAAVPGWSQATGTDEEPDNPVANGGMMTPPPVSGQAYPVATGDEVRNNYLNLGITAVAGYDNNVAGGYSVIPESDMIYSIWPSVTLDKNTVRIREQFNYSPGFTFYVPTSLHNETDENASGNFEYHPGSTATISVQDAFQRSSTLFNQPFATSTGDVTGTVPTQVTGVIAPFADRISNVASVQFNDQAGEDQMFGLNGQYAQLDYPDPAQVIGLYNSASYAFSAFANQRLSSRQYLGGEVQHARVVSYLTGTDSTLESDNFLGFYTIYFRNSQKSTVSLSITGGPEHYTAIQFPEANIQGWAPAATIAFGWQRHLSSLSANYSHNVTGGGGLPGAYTEDRMHALFRRELAPTWDLNFSGLYALNRNITPLFPFSQPGGHTLMASVSAEHALNRNLKFEIGYDWMDESYNGVGYLSKFPQSNREYGSITYQLTRPLGR